MHSTTLKQPRVRSRASTTSSAPTIPAASRPSLALLLAEPLRAMLEYASLRRFEPALDPVGDGHPVIVFPGLGTNGKAVGPLVSFCTHAGYSAYEWGKGYNTGPEGDIDLWLSELAVDVQQIAAPHQARMTLIGWSLGGIYARELAKLIPDAVRQVITIGTPFAGTVADTNVGLVYRLLNGQSPAVDAALLRRLAEAPAVPTTSIYSRTDGVVAWQACVQSAEGQDRVENVEVDGSHCGLGWNSEVLRVVGDRLRQRDGHWQPYRVDGRKQTMDAEALSKPR